MPKKKINTRNLDYSGIFRIFLTLVVLWLAISPSVQAVGYPAHSSPKIANYFLSWTLDRLDAQELSRWDILILDMETQTRSPTELREIRRLNPDIKILAYITASEIRSDASRIAGAAPLRARLASRIAPEWYLTDSSGNRKTFWSGTYIINVTDRAPMVKGQRFQDVLPRFVKDEIISSGMWDGVFYDNAWEDINQFAGGTVDIDRDGRDESRGLANSEWRDGLRQIYRRTRDLLGPQYIVMENDGPMYYKEVNGVMYENFPRNGWKQTLQYVERTANQSIPPQLPIINSNTANTGRFSDYRNMRFGLTSAMLYDAYYSFDYGDINHGQWRYYDEYDADIGRVVGKKPSRVDAFSSRLAPGVWRRDYERGTVVVNSTDQNRIVKLHGSYEKLRGDQDTAVNNGAVVNEVSLQAKDGIVLQKPLGTVPGAPFPNGSFTRIFNRSGSAIRNGFFAFDERFSGQAEVVIKDLDGDLREDTVVAQGGQVQILLANGSTKSFAPYGTRFKDRINIAVGDVLGGSDAEVIVAPATGGHALIKIYSISGKTLHKGFYGFDPSFPGGASIATGNLDGKGKDEIVVGAGFGGGPHVRVFNGNGDVRDRGFFAYDPRFRGGVYVAVGELTGDNKMEIVTGAGPSGGPHVRVWNGDGTPRESWFAYDKRNRSGVRVAVTDVDGNGWRDILAFTNDIFSLARTDSNEILAVY